MKILSLAPLAGPGIDTLEELGELTADPWNVPSPPRFHSADELLSRLAGVAVLIVEADAVPAEVLEGADFLQVVGTCRGDPVNVDIEAATRADVAVLRAPGRNATAVAELAVALAISLARGVVAADDDVRAGRWVVNGTIPQQRYLGGQISAMTVGLVGCGAVGREAGRLFAALGARVLGFDPLVEPAELVALGIEPASLGDLLARSDVVSLHAALTPETRGMIGAAELGRIRPGAFLVNTARFGLVEEEPLLEALRSGRLAGAAFDHFEGEFLPASHQLTSMDSVILTPHIGGATRETVVAHTTAMAEGLAALVAGRQPPNLVNPEVMPAFAGGRAALR